MVIVVLLYKFKVLISKYIGMTRSRGQLVIVRLIMALVSWALSYLGGRSLTKVLSCKFSILKLTFQAAKLTPRVRDVPLKSMGL